MIQQRILTNGIHLHVVKDGPSDGPLIIFLHGFPEFWYAWRKQIPFFAAAGYHVWAPDQRGYNLSDKPPQTAAYALDILGEDILGLIRTSGRDPITLVGHDWGGAVAWWVAAKYPQHVARLIILNAPHNSVMAHHLRRDLAQLRRSWYMFFFQIPWLPELATRAFNWYAAVRALKTSSRAGTFSAEDLVHYRRAWSQPGAYRAMLNWYRAIFRYPPQNPPPHVISVPTLLIWGAQDRFFERGLAEQSIDLCADGRLFFIEEATHWVQHEEGQQVNELLSVFLST